MFSFFELSIPLIQIYYLIPLIQVSFSYKYPTHTSILLIKVSSSYKYPTHTCILLIQVSYSHIYLTHTCILLVHISYSNKYFTRAYILNIYASLINKDTCFLFNSMIFPFCTSFVLHLQIAVEVPLKLKRTTFAVVQPKVSVLTVKPPRPHARVLMPTKDLFVKVRFRYTV